MQRGRAQAAEDAVLALREGIEANLDAEDLTSLVGGDQDATSCHMMLPPFPRAWVPGDLLTWDQCSALNIASQSPASKRHP